MSDVIHSEGVIQYHRTTEGIEALPFDYNQAVTSLLRWRATLKAFGWVGQSLNRYEGLGFGKPGTLIAWNRQTSPGSLAIGCLPMKSRTLHSQRHPVKVSPTLLLMMVIQACVRVYTSTAQRSGINGTALDFQEYLKILVMGQCRWLKGLARSADSKTQTTSSQSLWMVIKMVSSAPRKHPRQHS